MNKNYITTNEIIFPYISEELIEILKKVFPNKLPKERITDFELGVLIGQQKVIDRLEYEKNNKEGDFK